MAEDKESLFTVNAGQILAKLHLAARQASELGLFYAVNSGMKDDTLNDKPDNPGKALFDLTNKSGEYEVCLMTQKPVEYLPQIVLSAVPSVQKDLEKYNQLKEKSTKDKEADEKKGVTDKPNQNIQKSEDEMKKLQDKIFNEIKKIGVKVDSDDTFETVNKKIAEENEKRKKDQDQKLSKLKKDVVKSMNDYFKTFAGKDAKNVKEDQLVPLQFDVSVNDPSKLKIEDYKIEGMDEAELKKWNAEILKDLSKVVQLNAGYKVAFTVEVETM